MKKILLPALIAAAVIPVAACGSNTIGPTSVARQPYGCAAVTSQLVTFAHRVQASNGDVVADLGYAAEVELQLRSDEQDSRTPSDLAQEEIRLAGDLQTMDSPAATADVDAIHGICGR